MARPVSLMLNGSSTHATNVGGLLTILVYITVTAWYVWQTALSFSTPPTMSTLLTPFSLNEAQSSQGIAGFYNGSICVTVAGLYADYGVGTNFVSISTEKNGTVIELANATTTTQYKNATASACLYGVEMF